MYFTTDKIFRRAFWGGEPNFFPTKSDVIVWTDFFFAIYFSSSYRGQNNKAMDPPLFNWGVVQIFSRQKNNLC